MIFLEINFFFRIRSECSHLRCSNAERVEILISTFLFRFPTEKLLPGSTRLTEAVAIFILILPVKCVIIVLILYDRIRITGLTGKKTTESAICNVPVIGLQSADSH